MKNIQTENNIFYKAAQTIKEADTLLITAGAGMGVDSGLPDFRGDAGFWKAYPALQGYSFAEMANPSWFETDPHRAWGFYGHRLNLYRATQPHQGFQLLLNWTKDKLEKSFVFTSNVDGQFQKAGFDEQSICECHGSIHHVQSLRGGSIESADHLLLNINTEKVRLEGALPQHHLIVGEIRPNILMFGDYYWNPSRTDAQEERLSQWIQQHQQAKVVIIEMGAGTAIPSVRYQGERVIHQNPSATLIRINPREAQLEYIPEEQGISIPLGALEALTKLNDIYQVL